MADPIVMCPECGKVAQEDLSQFPPTEEANALIVPYACPSGHQFSHRVPLKQK